MDELISKREALASIKALYPNMMPIVDYFGARRKWFEKNKPYFECENAIMSLQPAKQESKTGHWIRKTKVDGVYDIAGVKTWGVKCQCDKCDFTTIVIEDFGYYKYCPNCGARMEVEQNG